MNDVGIAFSKLCSTRSRELQCTYTKQVIIVHWVVFSAHAVFSTDTVNKTAVMCIIVCTVWAFWIPNCVMFDTNWYLMNDNYY